MSMDKLEELTLLALGTDGVDVYTRIKHRDMAQAVELPTPGSNDPSWAKMGVIYGEPVEGDEKFFRHAQIPKGWKISPTSHYMYSNLVDDKGRPRAQIGFKAASYDRWTSISTIARFRVERVYHERKAAPPPREVGRSRRFVKYTKKEMQTRMETFEREMFGGYNPDCAFMIEKGYWKDEVEYEHFPAPICEDDTSVAYQVLDSGKEVFRSATLPLTDRNVDATAYYQDLERRQIACHAECDEWLVKQGFTDWKDVSAHWD